VNDDKEDSRDAAYEAAAERMNAAAAAYMRAHPFAEARFRFAAFEDEVAREAGKPGQRPAVIAMLVDVIDRVAGNEDARGLLRAMSEAVDGCTYLMAKVLVERQLAAALRRRQGRLTAAGDWHCPQCRALVDGYTPIDEGAATPAAGAILLCAYCAAFNRVSPEGDRLVAASTRDLNKLPTSARKQLFAARLHVARRIAKEKARS
jgi:hypothetical protein